MLELLPALWPLAIPLLVAAVAGDIAVRRSGVRALWLAVLAVFVASVATVTVIGLADHQPVLSQVAAAFVLYTVPVIAVTFVLQFTARRRWPPIAAIAAAFLAGALCMVPLFGPAVIAQGAFGGDTF